MSEAGAREADRTGSERTGSVPVPHIVVPPPGPRSAELLARAEKALYLGTGQGLAPLVLASKSGYTVTDVDGNVYLDMASASATVPLGAVRPDLLEPAIEALRRFGNEDTHALITPDAVRLAELLLEIAPPGISRVDIALNGTEAVEIALRMMRRATGRPLVLAFFGGYHGESLATAAAGAEEASIGAGLRTLAPGFVHVPYPNPYRSPFAPARPDGTGDATVDFIRDHLLFHSIDPRDVAGVLIEPVLGSGGVVAPSAAFWSALSELCAEHDWLLTLDEVKTGFGRTGRMFAGEEWGLRPDLMCLGKALGGGVMPIGAVLSTERVLGRIDDVPTGSTWAWLPAACAAALVTIDALRAPGVLEHVRAIEVAARTAFGALADRYPVIGDVRVKGAFIAVEFVADRGSKRRVPRFQDAVARACLARGLIADSSTTSYNIQPSLVTPIDVVLGCAGILADAIEEVLAANPQYLSEG
jgi:4-aminobutyrate aminotransferase-like enzyme